MHFSIFTFGKLKTPGLRETVSYYARLLQTWVPLHEFELKPLSVPDKSASTRTLIQEKEGTLLLNRIQSEKSHRPFTLLLDETGKARTTREWASEIQAWQHQGYSQVNFCIGSSLGFSPEVREFANAKWSLGPQTLSHDLARVVLLEQLYRSMSLLKGHPYHNEGS